MFTNGNKFTAAALAGLVLAGLAATAAHAQVGTNPNFAVRPVGGYGYGNGNFGGFGGFNGSVSVGGAAYMPGAATNPTLVTTPGSGYYPGGTSTANLTTDPTYGGYPPGYNSYYPPYYSYGMTPAYGYLTGLAAVTTANSQYYQGMQRARLLVEEVNRSQLDTRRRIIEEARWERMITPTPEQIRQYQIAMDRERSRRDPPMPEIYSARALNSLYDHLNNMQTKGAKGPNVPISEDVLKHINLTTGTDGSVGLIKNDLQWPLALQGPEFEKPRKSLSALIPDAVQQAKFNNPVAATTIKDIKADVQAMQDTLYANVSNLSPASYVEAKKFLNQLDDAVKALASPNASNYFTQKWTPKGRNVAELVDHMSKNGLRFAGAVRGDEWAYTALHRAMLSYDNAVVDPNARPMQPMQP